MAESRRPDVSVASTLEHVRAVQYQLHLQYPRNPVSDEYGSMQQ